MLIRGATAMIYLLLFVGPLAPRWALITYQGAGVPVEFNSLLIHLLDLPLLLAVTLWLLGHLRDPGRPIRFEPWFISGPLLALTALAGLSILWATSRPLAADMFLRLAGLLAMYLLVRNEFTHGRGAAWALAGGLVVQAALSTAQFYLQGPAGLSFLGETRPAVTVPWVRGYGLTLHPNVLGGYLAMGLAATLALALKAGCRRARLALVVVFGIGVSGLLNTFSRSAWLGAALGLGLAGVVVLPNQTARVQGGRVLLWLGLVGAGVSLLYLAAWPDYFSARLATPVVSALDLSQPLAEPVELLNLAARRGYSQVARQLIERRFPWGVGGGNFSLAASRLEPDLPPTHLYLPVHNIPLLLSAELGPLGGLTWLFLLLAFVLGLRQRRAHLAQNPWFLGWSLALLALFAASFFDFYLWSWQSGRVMLWLVLGLWAGSYSQGNSEDAESCSNGWGD